MLQVMEWERLYELLTDESVMIREQALGLVRNLVCGGEDVCTPIVSCLYPCFFLFYFFVMFYSIIFYYDLYQTYILCVF